MQAVAPTLTDAIWPRIGVWRQDAVRDVVLMVGFAWFVALCAQIALRLPWTTVPITGQTFAVLVTGGALGAWRGAGALAIYMLIVSGSLASSIVLLTLFMGIFPDPEMTDEMRDGIEKLPGYKKGTYH